METPAGRGESGGEADGWSLAVALVEAWQEGRGRADHLLEDLGGGAGPAVRGRAQALFFGAIRHAQRIDDALRPLLAHRPRSRLLALLAVAGGEIIENPETAGALVVDHAVGRAKRMLSVPESRLVNAVLRRAIPVWRDVDPPGAAAPVGEQAAFFSHPEWLVERWQARFGRDAARRLLEWNQTSALVQVRWRTAQPPPACLEAADWPGFFRLKPGHWSELEPAIAAGDCYLQDPATRLAPELADPQAGECLLDLCAAPGGKTFQLGDRMGTGRIVAVDRPGPRLRRFEENLARWRAAGGRATVDLLPADAATLVAAQLAARSLPAAFDAVVLDAPCSNTGVLRHRVDAKWRLDPGEFTWLGSVQVRLLSRAAAFVRPGGRLIYSTCSLEAEENEEVVATFLESPEGREFALDRQILARPWEAGHDGAGVFRINRRG